MHQEMKSIICTRHAMEYCIIDYYKDIQPLIALIHEQLMTLLFRPITLC